ncbi:MAG TPA: hypothetical protein VMH40_20345 [Myxococcaceae bacterium]|nr:hypothetical protein [Myxococcaceae bacterium]
MGQPPPLDVFTREVWSAVGRLWPNLGDDPASVVGPQIPVLPAFLAEAHREGHTVEAAAAEVTRFFLDVYLRNALTPEERNARLVDLHELSKRSYEESQRIGVLPFTAALFGAQQTLSEWATAGKVPPDAGRALNRDVLCALLGKAPGEVSRLGRLTLEASRKH